MPIHARDLVTTLFYAAGSIPAADVLRAWSAREQPGQWFLLVALPDGAYGVLAYDQLLSANVTLEDQRPLSNLVKPSPLFDDEAELATLRATPSPTGFYVIMRDGAPLGIVRQRRGAVLHIDNAPETLRPGQDVLRQVDQYANRYVNTDFVSLSDADKRLARTEALIPGAAYYFRVGIGEIEAGSIELQPASLPAAVLTNDNLLDVVVWSEDFGLDGQGQRGTLLVPVQGAVTVHTPAATPDTPHDDDESASRLFFRLVAPSEGGVATLRCNIYCRGLLLQSRLVRAVVGEGPALAASGARLESLLDFNLSSDLAPGLLAAIEPQRLSVMLNSTDDGSHSFRFVGSSDSEPLTGSVQLDSSEVGDMIQLTRARLREVAWGAPSEWNGETYRYLPDQKAAERTAQFRADLFALARRGAQQYEVIASQLAGSRSEERKLHELLRLPGQIQMASRLSASDVVPVALFYDYRLDDQAELTLCPAFEASLARGVALIDEPCFRGECPSRDQRTVVCPSGFWGFRHEIGMPYPVRPRGPEMAVEIQYHGTAQLTIAFYKDFPQGAAHLERLASLPFSVGSASPRNDVLTLFTHEHPHLVYFYCHGIDRDHVPFIRVGTSHDDDYISTSNILNYDVDWSQTRPLVFINGCHTAALAPDRALQFVRAFVEDALAAGVIGTEITVFEPLAQRFAETFLAQFATGVPLGRAIRMARLALLAEQNPLGLVYIPHAYAGLRMVAA